jgi:hypothetical protein
MEIKITTWCSHIFQCRMRSASRAAKPVDLWQIANPCLFAKSGYSPQCYHPAASGRLNFPEMNGGSWPFHLHRRAMDFRLNNFTAHMS